MRYGQIFAGILTIAVRMPYFRLESLYIAVETAACYFDTAVRYIHSHA